MKDVLTLLSDTAGEATHDHDAKETARRKRRRRSSVLFVVGMSVAAIGIAFAILYLLMPEKVGLVVEKAYGNTQSVVAKIQVETLGITPTLTLGASGGVSELDRCDGTFTEMLSYSSDQFQIQPVWAAHNNCGGDVVLSWETGQVIDVTQAGVTSQYLVADIRTTAKHWSTTEELVGMTGALIVQSCYYGEDKMRFVGLVPSP